MATPQQQDSECESTDAPTPEVTVRAHFPLELGAITPTMLDDLLECLQMDDDLFRYSIALVALLCSTAAPQGQLAGGCSSVLQDDQPLVSGGFYCRTAPSAQLVQQLATQSGSSIAVRDSWRPVIVVEVFSNGLLNTDNVEKAVKKHIVQVLGVEDKCPNHDFRFIRKV